MTLSLTDSPSFASAQPRLSVLIPFLRDNPAALVEQLDREAGALDGAVEVILLDDGTGDAALTDRLSQGFETTRLPLRLMTLAKNEGRSIGRNRLAAQARGDYLLFLDSDMKPDREGFLQAWLGLAKENQTQIAFGGFSLHQAPNEPRFAIHRAMAAKSDCLNASQRQLHPEKYVFTSNLLIQKKVLDEENFDPHFSGWGWEDVEWAMRVSKRYRVHHVDIPATHMGLDTVETLASKYEQSVPNFARVLAKHPEFVTAYPSYRVARLIRRLPLRGLMRASLRQMVRATPLPTPLRAFSLRLYRAALYAEVV
jgi:glycosyltransferase involved in cell wall biosynthesis